MEVGYVVCCAPRRSGSSLMHNLLVDVLETTGLSDRWTVVKAHHPSSPAYQATTHAPRKYVYVARDLRDVIVSDLTLHDLANTFPRVAAMSVLPRTLRSSRYWRTRPELFTTSYDSLIGDMAGQARELARFFGDELTPEQATRLADRHAMHSVQQRVAAHYADRPAAQATDIDSEVGFRKGHFQGGASGKWADALSPWQVAFIEFHAGRWLVDHGFPLSQPRWRRVAAAVLGAPFMIAGRAVVRAKLALGRAEVY